jgi:hypothetical protein
MSIEFEPGLHTDSDAANPAATEQIIGVPHVIESVANEDGSGYVAYSDGEVLHHDAHGIETYGE